MITGFTITTATSADQSEVLTHWEKLTLELPVHHYAPFGKPVIEKRRSLLQETLLNSLASSKADVFIIRDESQLVVATISVVLNEQFGYEQPDSGVIFNLWIEEGLRRRGVATLLVDHAKGWLKRHGATSVQVGWHPGNKSAELFWKKCGFQNYEVIAAQPL